MTNDAGPAGQGNRPRIRPRNRLAIVLTAMLLVLIGGIATSATLYIKRENIVRTITQSGSENFTWAFNQLRVEYYRLEIEAERAAFHDDGRGAARNAWQDSLRRRYELFVSRVNVVSQGVYRASMAEDPAYTAALDLARQLVSAVDERIGDSASFTLPALLYLREQSGDLGVSLDRLTARAVEVDSLRLEKMRDDLLGLRFFEFANLSFKLCLLLGFGGMAIFAVVRLDRQKRHLETVAEDLEAMRLSAATASAAEHRALTRALEEEQRNGQLQRRFVSMASHEFRTPLAIIDSAAQRLMRKAERLTPPEITARLQGIRNTVARLGELIETMLEAGRVSEGKIAFTPAPFDPAPLLQRLMKQQRDISPHHRLIEETADLPPVMVGDQRMITQIIVNLLSNAIKYSPQGGEVHLRMRGLGPMVEIAVTDQGVGIPEAELPHLFDIFFRASTSAGIPGTGLGLDMVKKFVEMHGGTVRVDSRVGAGSTFTVTLAVDMGAHSGRMKAVA